VLLAVVGDGFVGGPTGDVHLEGASPRRSGQTDREAAPGQRAQRALQPVSMPSKAGTSFAGISVRRGATRWLSSGVHVPDETQAFKA
jgi:hypothetical protein